MADKEKDQKLSEEIEEPDYLDASEDEETIVVEMVDEDGNEEYVEPTDEEFEAVLARYEEIMGEDEDS